MPRALGMAYSGMLQRGVLCSDGALSSSDLREQRSLRKEMGLVSELVRMGLVRMGLVRMGMRTSMIYEA